MQDNSPVANSNKWLRKLSIQWVILLSPIVSFILVAITVLTVYYLDKDAMLANERFIDLEYEKTKAFNNIANTLSRNHLKLYDHMRQVDESKDEGEFYDLGKLLLLEVYKQEKQAKTLIDSYQNDEKLVEQLKPFQNSIASYRNQIASALLLLSTDESRAKEIVDESNVSFNELNTHVHTVNELIHHKVNRSVVQIRQNTTKKITLMIVIIALIVGLLMLISMYLSRQVSVNLRRRVDDLNMLFADSPDKVEVDDTKNELVVLSQAIRNVQQNILSLRTARDEISSQERELRTTLESMSDAVITINEDGAVLSFNLAAEKLFEYSSDEVMGRNVKMLMPDPFAHNHDSYLKNYPDTGATKIMGSGQEVMGRKQSGDCFPMSLSVTELPTLREGKKCFIETCHDVSILKQQEEQIRRGIKMDALGKLTGGIAHDFNNLLAVILGITELVKIKVKGNGNVDILRYNEKIYAAATRGAGLTRKLLSFTRQVSENKGVVDINTILNDDRSMLEKTLTARIRLNLELEEKLWSVEIDNGDFADVILNMCINAMHAIERNGHIIIRTQNVSLQDDIRLPDLKVGDYVLLTITDDGCGMDADTVLKVFDPFFSTKGDMGTGLGLSQVYGFIKRSHGSINLTSEPGVGTTFSLYFPRHAGVENTQDKTIELDLTDMRGGETVLVVDDEESLQLFANELLAEYGYRVLTAGNGRKALEILKTERVELMITDIIMPEMDGFQLSAEVQKLYPDVRIQLMSGFHEISDEGLENKAIENKKLCENLLAKPCSAKDLLTRVRSLLDEPTGVS